MESYPAVSRIWSLESHDPNMFAFLDWFCGVIVWPQVDWAEVGSFTELNMGLV